MSTLRTLRKLTAEVIAISPRKAAASIALMAAVSVTEGVGLLLLMPLLGMVGINEPATMPNVDGWFAAAFAAVGVTPTLGSVLLFFVSIAALRALLMRLQSWVNVALREEFTSKLRVRVYRAIVGAQWEFLVSRRPSEFAHVLAGEVSRVGSVVLQIIELAVIAVISIVYLGLAFHLSWLMAALVLACAGALAWAVRRTLDRARASGRRASNARGKLHAAIAEHMGSMKTAKSYGAVDRHAEVFKRLSGELRDVSLEMTSEEIKLQQNLELASTVVLAVIVYVSFEILGVPAAQLLVLLFIFARLMPRLVTIYRRVQALAGALPIIDSVTDLERECLEAAESAVAENEIAPPRIIGFERVSFTYSGRAKTPALCDIDLEIRAGQTTAIVGPSGAGKSTLADLFMGLLSPTAGRILIDGKPLSAKHVAGWRRHISYVPQETFLFHDTVRANLAWARPKATDEELWQALRLSAADEFVARLPQGLDTIIGERGVLVSGGERQRLSLARALVRRPHILVLDEATSSLDSENEQRIQTAVEGLHQQITIVVITHRLSTIRHADLIHVFEQGRVVESGSWTALVARPAGRFHELCRAQGIDDRPAIRSEPAFLTELQTEPFDERATVIQGAPTTIIGQAG